MGSGGNTEELLNTTPMSYQEGREFQDLGGALLISLAEVSEIVKKLLSGKEWVRFAQRC